VAARRATKDGAGGRRSWETGKELRTGDKEGHEGGGNFAKKSSTLGLLADIEGNQHGR
jgi:hypothetical protein